MLQEDQAATTAQPQEEKHSWIGGILHQINTEFPLSGAETDDDLKTIFGHHESTPKHDHRLSWLKNAIGKIDAQFPLSGGE